MQLKLIISLCNIYFIYFAFTGISIYFKLNIEESSHCLLFVSDCNCNLFHSMIMTEENCHRKQSDAEVILPCG